MIQRKWLNQFDGMVYQRTGGQAEGAAMSLSPEYTDAGVDKVGEASQYSLNKLLGKVITLDLSRIQKLDCPVVLFLGRHDHNVSSSLAAAWFGKLQAPSKRLVWFENSAHEVAVEEPGKTLMSLVTYVQPLAEKAASHSARSPRVPDDQLGR